MRSGGQRQAGWLFHNLIAWVLGKGVRPTKFTILMKLRWAALSGGSERQFTDALRVYEV
jgi:hypothetical protein